MKTSLSLNCFLLASATVLPAQKSAPPASPPPPVPPPVSVTVPAAPAPAPQVYVYEQKLMGGRSFLVTPEQAQAAIAKFKDAYAKAGSPRILVLVNRELVDEHSGLKLSARKESIETTRSSDGAANAAKQSETQKATQQSTYRIRERQETPLADKQTMRDVERLFGRPLRLGGATLVDQRVATQMHGGETLNNLATRADGEQARREREVTGKIADVVLEVLITSRNMTVSGISGDQVITVPDIQATAIRLSDSKILGQATAADLLNRAGNNARYYDVREVTESTALALMEDMSM